MDHIKKLRTKVFKKGGKQRKDPKLRYSRSMPLRNSSDTDESYTRPRPILRTGDHPLKESDNHCVFDAPPRAVARKLNTNTGWSNDEEEEDLTGGPYYQRYGDMIPFIDRKIVDQFPAPPTAVQVVPRAPAPPVRPPRPAEDFLADLIPELKPQVPSKPPARPPRPTTMKPEELTLVAECLPDLDPSVQDKINAYYAEKNEERRCEIQAYVNFQKSFQRRPKANSSNGHVKRSNSSASNFRAAGGPSAYPAALTNYLAHEGPKAPASSGGVYHNPAHNLSTHSLGANAHLRSGPVAHTPSVVFPADDHNRRRLDSSASGGNIKPGMYSNASHNLSTRSLGPTAPLRPARAPTGGGIRTAARNRGESSASANLAAPAHSAGTTEVSYYPDVTRVMRGPHAAKLQAAAQGQAGRLGIAGLEVNDSNITGDWGVAAGKSKKAFTIAGKSKIGHF